MVKMLKVFGTLLIIVVVVASGTSPAQPDPLVVVGDAKYPPFEFLSPDGEPHGIFVDVWSLWSQKTGVQVEYRLMEWSKALKAVEKGEADVVGGIFVSPERSKKFSFSSHYYQIPANIFFHSSIYGLKNLEDLDGFRVGLVAQDYSVTYLLNHRPALNLALYSNAEMMVKAARKGEIRVMVGDAPVIRFYLAKYELIDEFKQTAKALYTERVCSAVKKGNTQTLNLLIRGFAEISDAELAEITEKWVGKKVWKRLPWFWISIGLTGGVLVFLVMFLWNRQLSRRIQKATSDIRSKQQALEKSRRELKESEAFFRHFTEHTEDCIMRFDRGFRHLYVNRVAELTTGIKMADFIGKTHQELGFPEELTKQWHYALEEVFGTGEPTKIEFRLPNGIWMDWLVFPEKDPNGQVKNVMTSAREITARKKAEDEIRRLSQFLEGVIENANVWLTVLDSDYRVLIWNRAAELISGYNRREVVGSGKIWRRLFTDSATQTLVLSKIKEVYDGGLSLEDILTPIRTNMGGKKVIAWNLRPFTDEKGKSSGLIAMGRDVTENAELEERLRQSQKMEAIGTLASGVAHDFNNLLQAITSYVQLLLLKCQDRADEHKYLMEIAGSVDRAADLVNQLLAFGRKVASRPKLLDLNHLVEKVAKLLERTIPKMVSIEIKPAPDLRLVNADSTQLEQVLVNLANNARDAMPEGGRLTIVTENVYSPGREDHSLGGLPKGDYVKLTVIDTGSGMDRETVSHIFEPFFTTKEVGKGTGLGLAMAYGIIKAHKGVLLCQSEPSQGSVFSIYLPAAPKDAVLLEKPEPFTEKAKGNRETILLVDDEAAIRKAAKEFLELNNYRVFTAENGEQGIAVFREYKQEIALVILDLGMPGMGGAKAMSRILEVEPKARILIASGYSQQKQVRDSLNHGAGGFIAKPYRLLDLMKKIGEMISS